MKNLIESVAFGDAVVLRMAASLVGAVNVETAALIDLLIRKGVFTEDEFNATADKLLDEVAQTLNQTLVTLQEEILREFETEESK